MKTRQIPGLDKALPPIVFGTDRMTSRVLGFMPSRRREHRWFELLDAAFDAGVTMFDTATMYGLGDSERTLGRWVRSHRLESQVTIVSKGCFAYPWQRRRVTPKDLTADLHASLHRLGLETVDLYILHQDDPNVPPGPLLQCLDGHVRSGKIKLFGASNWSMERLELARCEALKRGVQQFSVSSPYFSLAEWAVPLWPGSVSLRGDNAEAARKWHTQHKVTVLAYSCLGRGYFGPQRDLIATKDSAWRRAFMTPENEARRKRATELAERRGVTMAQIALAFVLAQPFEPFAVVGCSQKSTLLENIKATTLSLSETELSWLDRGEGAIS